MDSRLPSSDTGGRFLLSMPTDVNDPNFLGDGTSKRVWRWENFAIVNGTDAQRGITFPHDTKHIKEKNIPIQMEYNFTVYLHQLFMSDPNCPFVIPRVYLFQDRNKFRRPGLFRYAKELCEKVVVNDELVNTMIKISDYLSEKGWVYLDMKPDNLGLLNGKICILDTDYSNFYRVPPELKEDFRNWSYLIIVMFSYLFLQGKVTNQTLDQIIRSKNLNEKMLKDLWSKQVDDAALYGKQLDEANDLASYLIDYGNAEFKKVDIRIGEDVLKGDIVQKYIQLGKGDIVCSYSFYLQYGQPEKKSPIEQKGPKPQIKLKLPLRYFQFMMDHVLSKEIVEPEVESTQNDVTKINDRFRNQPGPKETETETNPQVPKKQASKNPVPRAKKAPMTGTVRGKQSKGPGSVTRKAIPVPRKRQPTPSGLNVPPAPPKGTSRMTVRGRLQANPREGKGGKGGGKGNGKGKQSTAYEEQKGSE